MLLKAFLAGFGFAGCSAMSANRTYRTEHFCRCSRGREWMRRDARKCRKWRTDLSQIGVAEAVFRSRPKPWEEARSACRHPVGGRDDARAAPPGLRTDANPRHRSRGPANVAPAIFHDAHPEQD